MARQALESLRRQAAGKSGPTTTRQVRPAGDDNPVPAALRDHPRYTVLKQLGVGGMGVVFKAEHRIMGREVALKVMAAHLTAKRGAVERFRKEVRAAAQLYHPNIVTAFDADEAGGLHFLVMEYVRGTSLDRLVSKRGPLPVAWACSLTRQAALGLQHAHEKGMVHRDIKPQNMMVTRKGELKVMDFGLARLADGDDDSDAPSERIPFAAANAVASMLTNPNLVMGTPDFLAPEQARNSHNVDARADVYSLGCNLFYLLTARAPFGHAPTVINKLLAHSEDPPPDVRVLRPEVPEALVVLLEKMLAKRPDDRYQTAGEVAAALDALLNRSDPEFRTAVADPPSSTEVDLPAVYETHGLADASAGDTPAEPLDPAAPLRRRKPQHKAPWWELSWKRVALLALVPLILTVGALVALKFQSPPPPKTNPYAALNTPPQERTLGKAMPFLIIVPSRGVNVEDYYPLRRRLMDAGLRVVTASGRGGVATPPLFTPDAPTVTVDLRLEHVDPATYSGVAFCGLEVEEYTDKASTDAAKVRGVLDAMRAANKPVGAVCAGEGVLASHGVLDGRTAAKSPLAVKRFPKLMDSVPGATWTDQRVVSDSRVVTARAAADAPEFADALVRVLKAE